MHATLGLILHPPLFVSHSFISKQAKPFPVNPAGQGPHMKDPGKLMHCETQGGFASSHSFISTLQAGVNPFVFHPCWHMHVYPGGAKLLTQVPWSHNSTADDLEQSEYRSVQWTPTQPGLHEQLHTASYAKYYHQSIQRVNAFGENLPETSRSIYTVCSILTTLRGPGKFCALVDICTTCRSLKIQSMVKFAIGKEI